MYYCFVDSADGKHYKLDATDVGRWSKAINAGNTTLDRPTDRMRAYFVRRDSATTKKAKVINESSASMHAGVQNTFNLSFPNFNDNGRRMLGISSSPITSISQKRQLSIQESSPIISDDDHDTELDRYFIFLVDKFTKHADKLNEAKRILESKDTDDLKSIRETPQAEMEGWGLTPGIVRKIKRYTKDFSVTS